MISFAVPAHCVLGANSRVATTVTASTVNAAGSSRCTRRAQNTPRSPTPFGGRDNRCDVIKNPEITKKTSTPTYPPANTCGQMWNTTTSETATARKP
ncbi:hypothetical protein GCM10022199_09270 [Marihabitans asiaticum]